MAVGFSNTNKPINPRGNDASPKGYNRASLFSGKALDFDGVNDYVDIGQNLGFINTGDFTYLANAKFDVLSGDECIMGQGSAGAGAAILALVNGNGFFRFAFYGDDLDWDEPVETGKWYSLAFTYNRTTKARAIYVNGQLAVSDVSTLTPSATSNNFVIGKVPYSATYADAQITGVKVFNTALTAAQVADLYNNPEKVAPTGVDNTALKLWLPMQEGAGTKCLDGASLNTATERVENGDFSDGTTGWVGNPDTTLSVSNGQLDIQSAGTGYGAAFTEVNFTSGKYYLIQLDVISCDVPTQIRIGSKNDPTLYSTNIWSSGEIGIGSHSTIWYATTNDTYLAIGGRDDIDTLVIDNVSVKEINVGDISGATWTHGIGAPVAQTSVIDWNKRVLDKTNEFLIPQGLTSGRDLLGNLFENVRKQGALNLDGNSWAEVHDNASLDFTSGMSLEAWVQIDDADGINQHILGKWNSSGAKKEYLMYYGHGANLIQFYFGHGASVQSASFPITATGQWFHFVGTTDGTTITPYVNGVAGTTGTQTTALAASDIDVTIGTDDSKGSNAVQKQLAQPRIYNRALTAAEVLQNYNSGKNTYK